MKQKMKLSANLIVVAALVFGTTVGAQHLTLSDADVDAAIRAGLRNDMRSLFASCDADAGLRQEIAANLAGGMKPTGGFRVTMSTNIGRITRLAADAKRLYQPFTVAHVPEHFRQAGVVVVVEPKRPTVDRGRVELPAEIQRVILKPKATVATVVQPETLVMESVEWTNLFGATFRGNHAVAIFSHAAVSELPPDAFDVVVITIAGERRCKVDRDHLFLKR
jgi:hypothetical protein